MAHREIHGMPSIQLLCQQQLEKENAKKELRRISKELRRETRKVLIREIGHSITLGFVRPENELISAYHPSYLIDVMVPFDRAQDMHANLAEVYPRWVERHGRRRALLVQRMQIGWLIGGTWWEKLLSSAERVLKIVRPIGS